MEPVVELSKVEVRRQGRAILRDVNWQVGQSQNWVVLGPNGAGKTTLVKVLTGRVFPSFASDGQEARALIAGHRLGECDVSELRTVVGMASAGEEPYLPGTLSVLDALISTLYGRSVRGREEVEESDLERARDLLALFGLAELADRPLASLSQGERQRALIARALIADPQILILDEPTAGLDLGVREMLVEALEEIARDRRAPALILVTHHVEEIPPGFTHAALMSDGQIVAAGKIEEVLEANRLSEVFGLPLEVGSSHGRWWARAAREDG